MRRIGALLCLLALVQFVAWVIPADTDSDGVAHYLVWHSLMESVSIVIAMMVFAVGWNTRRGRGSGNLALLACLFFVIGALDFSHTFSYAGMPDFFTHNNPDKQLNFWMSARFLAALALLLAAMRPWQSGITRESKYALFAALIAATMALNVAVIKAPDAMPTWFVPGQGLTPLKKGLEYVYILMNLVTALLLWRKMRRPQAFNAPLLFGAACVMGMGEFFFTLYTTMTGAYNVLGHVYKVISYLLIYRAVVVETIDLPYAQLAKARQNLELAVKASNTGLWDWELGSNEVTYSPVWKSLLGHADDELDDRFDNWSERLHPGDRAEAMARLDTFVNTGTQTLYESEFRMRHKDGSYRWILARGEKQLDAQGKAVRVVGSHTDMTERRRAEGRFRSAVEAAPNAMIMVDESGSIVLSNARTERLFGYPPGSLTGKPIGLLIPDATRADHARHMANYMRAPSERSMGDGRELLARHKLGHDFRVEVGLTPIGGHDEPYVIASVVDITDRIEAEQRIHQLVNFDFLTGLPNRQLLNTRVRQAIEQAQAGNTRLAIVFIDIDHFKHVNDTLGHAVGDKLLVEAGRRLTKVLPHGDTVARIGGDEFVLVLSDGNADAVALAAKKLISTISHPYRIEAHELAVTPSIGVAFYPEDGLNFDSLYQHADTAMYRAKQEGRNDFRFFTQDMQSRTTRILTLESAMHRALEHQEFYLDYQPQLSMDGKRLVGVEALLRWRHPELGMVAPGEFIPLAENNGQIIAIGSWVLRTAVQQLKAWMDAGLPPMVMAVNLSAVQFRHVNLPAQIAELLEEAQLAPEFLELELTESVAMGNPLGAVAIMDKLHGRGVRMSIDDFGTGYSSLSYLKKFKVYKLKIDQSFVRDIATDEDDRAIVSAIIQMAHSLGFITIAEGVETPAQRNFLLERNCDEVQGFLFAKPMAPALIAAFVKKING
jgi:diguanylate cyclase (GGDEF)-like protein/PAS domain S-box-containing protein